MNQNWYSKENNNLQPETKANPGGAGLEFNNLACPRRIRDFSIKWKVFFYFVVFSVIMICVLWIFQVVFLNDFYKSIKTKSIVFTADSVARELNTESDSQTISDKIMDVAQKNDVCIMVLNNTGSIIYSAELSPACIIHRLNYPSLYGLIEGAKVNGGNHLYKLDVKNNDVILNFNADKGAIRTDRVAKNKPESIIYAKVINGPDNNAMAILVNSNITPVDATVQTIRSQLMVIMCIMLFVGLILALLVSKRISRPIIKINNSSKELAKGNYDIDFATVGYEEIVELGETLNIAAKELGRTERLQRDLIANISHDLRTPLTMITGYAEVMRDLPGENSPENVQVIIDEANRLTTLVNDVLDMSKLQSGTQTLELRQYNLTESIRKIMERFNKLTADEGYEINFEYTEDVEVFADEIKISQVVYNLMTNAINYTGEDKKITVTQKIVTSKKHSPKVRIDVVDTGVGIAEDKLKEIWQRYYKLDKTHQRPQTGSGLGLSIVRSVLEMHNAVYGVESVPGKGSDFWFILDIQA